MRIIGGIHKGRRLKPPESRNIRPTTDRMRETLFNLLQNSLGLCFADCHVLDAFAGTGALGLEALSRGAAHVTFVEKNPRALRLLKENVALLKAEKNTTVKSTDACSIKRPDRPFALVFLDPPYHRDLLRPALDNLHTQQALTPNAYIVAEYSSKEDIVFYEFLEKISERIYGDSKVSIFRYHPHSQL
tara:strand:+ start:885 stop:1448 length:564 start_codon:yes stop_codon:yes gene_type:complete